MKTTTTNTRRFIRASNVISLSERRGQRLSSNGLVFDASYSPPDRLGMRGPEVTRAAISDSRDARRQAINEINFFLQQPENAVPFGEAIDGVSARERAYPQTQRIDDLVMEYRNDTGDSQARHWPSVSVGAAVASDDVQETTGSALPLPVSMAFVNVNDADPVLLLSGRLGFKDMLLQTRAGLFMSIEEKAINRGVGPSTSGAWQRLSALFNDGDPLVLKTPPADRFLQPDITAMLSGELYQIRPSRYLIDSEAAR
ncbi:hypothetical protein [Yoonia sp. SS1-5]|uniref:Uncharacterized protein n=1 Tax=Yoonia rhodophyticola TaxID=3137370 RepID=A0AAN0MMA1_9RHOB